MAPTSRHVHMNTNMRTLTHSYNKEATAHDAGREHGASPPNRAGTSGLGFTVSRDAVSGQWIVRRLKEGGFAERCRMIFPGQFSLSRSCSLFFRVLFYRIGYLYSRTWLRVRASDFLRNRGCGSHVFRPAQLPACRRLLLDRRHVNARVRLLHYVGAFAG